MRMKKCSAIVEMATREAYLRVLQARPLVVEGVELLIEPHLTKKQIQSHHEESRRRRVYVCNVPFNASNLLLREIFEGQFGEVETVKININLNNKSTMGNYAFVIFKTPAAVAKALKQEKIDFSAFVEGKSSHYLYVRPYITKVDIQKLIEKERLKQNSLQANISQQDLQEGSGRKKSRKDSGSSHDNSQNLRDASSGAGKGQTGEHDSGFFLTNSHRQDSQIFMQEGKRRAAGFRTPIIRRMDHTGLNLRLNFGKSSKTVFGQTRATRPSMRGLGGNNTRYCYRRVDRAYCHY